MPPRTAPIQSNARKLKIQVGICKRMNKEVESYHKEVITNEARVQKMRDEGRDIYDIRKQEEVLQESYMMIPDSKGRLESSLADLSSCLEECRADPSIEASLLHEANELLQASSPN